MADSPPSPKRRRILSSMNPDGYTKEEKSASPEETTSKTASAKPRPTDQNGDNIAQPEPSEPAPKPSKFRFKSKHSSRHRDDDGDDHNHSSSSRRRHHHRHKRRPRTTTTGPSPEPPPIPASAEHNPEPGDLSPNAAFRESLFDAMADDEGAAYWQGVYGQPIHVYSRERGPSTDPGTGAGGGGEGGELERMTDDEYAAYVRRRMWEKTHAGLLEERARREEERKRKEKEKDEGRRIAEEMERSLRRGEERRRRKLWKEAREFFEKGLDREELGEKEFSARLKEERVRWHPDKVQQKLGGTVEGDVMKDVTAIFQTIDKLWNDTRPKA